MTKGSSNHEPELQQQQLSDAKSSSKITPGNDTSVPSHKKGVCWGDVTIYEFPNILGDNPAVSNGGSPITIGWKCQSMNTVDVEFYEYVRQSHPRRSRRDLILKSGERDS